MDNDTALSSSSVWALDGLVNSVGGATLAIVVSADGLVLTHSSGVSRNEADIIAAQTAGMVSVGRSMSASVGGGAINQTLVQMDQRVVFITAAGANASLLMVTDTSANFGDVSYEMSRKVAQIGGHLSASPRPTIAGADRPGR